MYNMTMKQPLVSIIIPVYNVSELLPNCLGSLKDQTYQSIQIIIIDDGSTDNSGNLCDSFAKEDSRVVVKHQNNAGLSAARNAGLDIATGDYVFFLDSDDYLAKDCLEYLVSLAKSSVSPIAVCSHFEQRSSKDLRDFNSGAKSENLSVEQALKNMLNEHGFNLQVTPKLFSRSLFESTPKIRFPKGKLHEDVGTTYRLFLRAYDNNPEATIAYGVEPKYYYTIRENSITNRNFDPKKLDLISQTDEMCDAIETVFPTLKNVTNLRRLHARFSILRQAKTARYQSPCITYIKEHKSWITKNPEATKRDKLALASLMLGKTPFKIAWRTYELFFK